MINKLMKKNRSNKGLTLVELVIVIGIIAVIVAVVGAFIIRYIEKSKIHKDVANANLICDAAVTAIGEPEVRREFLASTVPGGSISYVLTPGGATTLVSKGYPLFEQTLPQYAPKAPEFSYLKYNPTQWNVILSRDGDNIVVNVTVTTSAGDVKLAPKAEAPYDK